MNLKDARKKLGMTQAALADALGLSTKFVGMMERGAPIERRTELAVRYLLACPDSPNLGHPRPAPPSRDQPAVGEDGVAFRAAVVDGARLLVCVDEQILALVRNPDAYIAREAARASLLVGG